MFHSYVTVYQRVSHKMLMFLSPADWFQNPQPGLSHPLIQFFQKSIGVVSLAKSTGFFQVFPVKYGGFSGFSGKLDYINYPVNIAKFILFPMLTGAKRREWMGCWGLLA